ncbi:MAG: pyridoxal-phosphate-dependent aminotransferase family protein [Acidobacteriota bacterium]
MTEREIHLFIPGPAGAEPEVLEALARPITPHYGSDFVAAYRACQERMKRIFRTDNDLYLMVGPGTAALDGAMASALPDGARVLVPTNGWFGDRMARMFRTHRAEVEVMDFPLGTRIDADSVVERMAREPRLDAVGWVHHETSTGVLNPVREIAAAGRQEGILSIIDAVSSLGGTELAVDDWGVDLCVSVANKSLASQPGLAAISVSPQAWRAIDANPHHRSWYLDLRTWRAYDTEWADWHPYPTTVPTGLVYALDVALELILEEGLENRLERTRAAAWRVRSGLREMGFEMFVPDEIASPVTTSVRVRDDVPAAELIGRLQRDHGIYISGGIEELHGKIFRIGHMGSAIKAEEVELLLDAIRGIVADATRVVEASAEAT